MLLVLRRSASCGVDDDIIRVWLPISDRHLIVGVKDSALVNENLDAINLETAALSRTSLSAGRIPIVRPAIWSLNHFAGSGQEPSGYRETERLRRHEINHDVDLLRLVHGHFAGIFAT